MDLLNDSKEITPKKDLYVIEFHRNTDRYSLFRIIKLRRVV